MEKIFEWEHLQHQMPSFWSKILKVRNNPRSMDTLASKNIANSYMKKIVLLCSFASVTSNNILKEGERNLAQMERWMGEIINFESASVSEYSYIVRNAVDCLSRGDALPELYLAYTQ